METISQTSENGATIVPPLIMDNSINNGVVVVTEIEDETDLFQNRNKISGGLKKMGFYQNLRHQLTEQLKSLELRLESQLQITNELQDYFKKRSEMELEFSKMLEKMYKSQISKRNKENIPLPGMLNNLLLNLLNDTKKEGRERGVLGEICGIIVNRLGLICEDLTRIFKQCHSVCLEGQEELLKVLQELYVSSKSYQTLATEWKQCENKLKQSELQKSKAENGLTQEKIEKSKKIKSLEKEVQKRLRKTNDTKFKALKAKNEYILCMDASNAAIQKYFVEDLSDLIDCMDLGYYESIAKVLKLFVWSEEIKKESLSASIEFLEKILSTLDCRVDKQKFLEGHNTAFVLPKKFEFGMFFLQDKLMMMEEEENAELATPPLLQEELEQRMFLLDRRLSTLKIESNELWKTLETAENSLLNLIDEKWHCGLVREWFAVGSINNALLQDGNSGSFKNRSDRIETDQFHINKYRDWMLSTSKLARLESKQAHIKDALGLKRSSTSFTDEMENNSSTSEKMKRRKRIGQRMSSNCRLFGGSIEEYIEINKCQIPLIMKSCVRVVNLFGLHHQGIFRVSGSQVEINNFREAFERGEDPLCELTDASDINSVASLLKLYLRELREPLFPIVFFDCFMEMAQLDNETTFKNRMRELVMKCLPRCVFVVLRYLFHFLNHLSEYSDENMMDPYNLAICFGPTLVPVPEDKDQVQYQNLVNELIKNVIVYAIEVFPNDGCGEEYRKFGDDTPTTSSTSQSSSSHQHQHQNQQPQPRPSSATSNNSKQKHHHHHRQNSNMSSSSDMEILEDELEIEGKKEELNATAQYDFKGRSGRELSFKKGMKLRLIGRVSGDWWRGFILSGSGSGGDQQQQQLGLIPHKYIHILGPPPPPTQTTANINTHPKTPPPPPKIPPIPSDLLLDDNDVDEEDDDDDEEEEEPPSSTTSSSSEMSPKIRSGEKNIVTVNKMMVVVASSSKKENNRLSIELMKTPDLVLDLPNKQNENNKENNTSKLLIGGSSSGDDEEEENDGNSSTSSSSEDIVTAAEVFAKNQCTLKKFERPPKPNVKPKLFMKKNLKEKVNEEAEFAEEGEQEHENKKTD